MKTIFNIATAVLLTVAVVTLAPAIAGAQDYELSSFSVSGGGGFLGGGVFDMDSSIGQHDAGNEMAGGAYTVVGGFLVEVGSELVVGDANDDGELNNLDIASFVLALINPVAYQAMFPDVDPDVVLDMNGDGGFDNLDIASFVAALTGGKK